MYTPSVWWRPGERRAQVLQPKGNDVAILEGYSLGVQKLGKKS